MSGREQYRDPPKGPLKTDEVNPYIPKFITNTPWYAGEGSDPLEHQRSRTTDTPEEPKKQPKRAPPSTTYRPGACTNCGAMSHKAVDCMERPRKVGAKYSGRDIKPDEDEAQSFTSWDSKRDRWSRFEADDYKDVVDSFEEAQEKKRQQEAERMKELAGNGGNVGEDAAASFSSDSDSDSSDSDFGGTLRLARTKRSGASAPPSRETMRDRADRAPYLENLADDETEAAPDLDSSREKDPTEFERLRRKAEQASESGTVIQLESSPTVGLLKLRQMQEAEERQKSELKRRLLDKYGGAEHLVARPKEVAVAPVEGTSQPAPVKPVYSGKSKYPEDVFIGNHTSVWGSYWRDGEWGFACCHSLVKHSYCLGEKGIEINDKPMVFSRADNEPEEAAKPVENPDDESNTVVEELPEKARSAAPKRPHEADDKEMEQYYRGRHRADDPMAK